MNLYEILDRLASVAAESQQEPLIGFQLVLQPYTGLNPFLVLRLAEIEGGVQIAHLFQEFLEFFYCEGVYQRGADFVPPADCFKVALPALFKGEVEEGCLHSIF